MKTTISTSITSSITSRSKDIDKKISGNLVILKGTAKSVEMATLKRIDVLKSFPAIRDSLLELANSKDERYTGKYDRFASFADKLQPYPLSLKAWKACIAGYIPHIIEPSKIDKTKLVLSKKNPALVLTDQQRDKLIKDKETKKTVSKNKTAQKLLERKEKVEKFDSLKSENDKLKLESVPVSKKALNQAENKINALETRLITNDKESMAAKETAARLTAENKQLKEQLLEITLKYDSLLSDKETLVKRINTDTLEIHTLKGKLELALSGRVAKQQRIAKKAS